MPFDFSSPQQPSPPKFPPAGMWHDPKCSRCRGQTAYGNNEACNLCGKYADGTLD